MGSSLSLSLCACVCVREAACVHGAKKRIMQLARYRTSCIYGVVKWESIKLDVYGTTFFFPAISVSVRLPARTRVWNCLSVNIGAYRAIYS